LPVATTSALAAPWPALGDLPAAETGGDQAGEIATRPTAATRAEARNLVLVLERLAEGAYLDAFHSHSSCPSASDPTHITAFVLLAAAFTWPHH
jgi:hypothetical protein